MAQAVDTFADDAPTRRPGDFYRSKAGTPYVSEPSGATVKSGPRKGEARRLAYGRPSSFGKQIEDGYALAKWGQRQVALGLGIDYAQACEALALPALVAQAANLAGRDQDDQEWRSDADGVVVEAIRIAKSMLAAERGTQVHTLTEDDDSQRDWIARAEVGEVLGLDVDVQRSLVDAWREMLERDGLEILAVEMAVVHDGYRMAGTLDRIARLTRPLRFAMAGGEIAELTAGTVVVLDLKTGQRRTNASGYPAYWQAYAVQVCVYAGGVPYDVYTEARSAWAWEVDQRWALIAHLDVLGALDGNPSCELVLVDIAAGRAAADLCLAAKAWEKRSDVFSVAKLVPVEVSRPLPPPADSTPEVGSPEPPEIERRSEEVAATSSATPPAAPTPDPPTPAEVHARLRAHPDIDEGTVADPENLGKLFALLAEQHIALDPAAKAWFADLVSGAMRNRCSFHARQAQTLRRFEIIRGLLALAIAGLEDHELVRYLVEAATGCDAVQFPCVHPGHAVGSMDAAEAARFAQLATGVVDGSLALTFTDDGRPLFVTAPQLVPA